MKPDSLLSACLRTAAGVARVPLHFVQSFTSCAFPGQLAKPLLPARKPHLAARTLLDYCSHVTWYSCALMCSGHVLCLEDTCLSLASWLVELQCPYCCPLLHGLCPCRTDFCLCEGITWQRARQTGWRDLGGPWKPGSRECRCEGRPFTCEDAFETGKKHVGSRYSFTVAASSMNTWKEHLKEKYKENFTVHGL